MDDGIVSVTVTDANGCTGSDTENVSVDEALISNITPSFAEICEGDSVTLTADPAPSYLWSTGETTQSIVVTDNGSYTVQRTNGSCVTTSSPATVIVNPAPNVTNTGPTTACGTATLDAGIDIWTYLWSTGETTQTIDVTTSGTYSVTVTNPDGCSSTDSHTITINTPPAVAITGPATACDSAVLFAGAGFAS